MPTILSHRNTSKFLILAFLMVLGVSNSVLASDKEFISCKDLKKAIPTYSYGLVFDVVVLNNHGSIESKLVFKVPVN